MKLTNYGQCLIIKLAHLKKNYGSEQSKISPQYENVDICLIKKFFALQGRKKKNLLCHLGS